MKGNKRFSACQLEWHDQGASLMSILVSTHSAGRAGAALVESRDSPIHGKGVYARELIPRDTRLLEYTGEKITKAEAKKREERRLARVRNGKDSSVYIFVLNQRFDLDGRSSRNVARLINHSCEPNCRAEKIRGRIWIIARREIAAGDELTFDYGFPYKGWSQHVCRCGARGCVGYIVTKEQRWRVRRLLREKRKLARMARGRVLLQSDSITP